MSFSNYIILFRRMPLLVLGIVLTLFSLFQFLSEYEQWHYQESQGEVISIRLLEKFDEGKKYFLPYIRYQYKVNDETYEGNHIYKNECLQFEHLAEAQEAIKWWKKQKDFSVFYHPKRPDDSFLIKRIKSDVIGRLLIGLFILVLGLFPTRVKKTPTEG